jgi:hypothetical protein
MEQRVQPASRGSYRGGRRCRAPEEVAPMLRLTALGWNVRRLGRSHNDRNPVSGRGRGVAAIRVRASKASLVEPSLEH